MPSGSQSTLALAGVACGGREGPPVGVSPPRAAERVAGVPDAAAAPPSWRPRTSARTADADRRAIPLATGTRRSSTRSSGRTTAGRRRRGRRRRATLPRARCSSRRRPRDGVADGGAAGLLVMEKRAGAWRFAAVSPEGDVVERRTGGTVRRVPPRGAPRLRVSNAEPPRARRAAASAAMTTVAPMTVATAAAT